MEDTEKSMDDDLLAFDPGRKVAVTGQLIGHHVKLGLDDGVDLADLDMVLWKERTKGTGWEGGHLLIGSRPAVQGG